MNKNNLNIFLNKVFGKLMRCYAVMLLLLIIVAKTNQVSAFSYNSDHKRYYHGELWFSIEWNKDRGAFYVTAHAYDESGRDEWFAPMSIEINGDLAVEIRGKGSLVAYTEKSGCYSISVTSRTEKDISFYMYPDMDDLNEYCTVSAKENENNSWKRVWSGTTSLNDFTTSISDLKFTESSEDLSIGVNVPNITNKYSNAKIRHFLQYSKTKSIWNDRESNTNVNSSNYTFNVEDWGNDCSGNRLTAQEFANGVYFRVKYDMYSDYGKSTYTKYYYSDILHTGSTAVIKDNKLTATKQDNRNITLSWNILQPKGNPSNQDMSDFEVLLKVGDGEWKPAGNVDFSKGKTGYSYTYTLSDAEINKGNVEYKFRVWKKRFSDPDVFKDFMTSEECKINVNTNYDELEIVSITPINEKTEAEVVWKRDGNGIWDDGVTVKLIRNNITQTNQINSLETKSTLTSLQSCEKYSVQVECKLGEDGKRLSISDAKEFVMPNLDSRTINNLQVSKGYYNNAVELSWDVPSDESDFKYFDIVRTPLLGGEAVSLSQLEHLGLTRYTYRDNQMDAGVLYTYTVNGYAECNGEIFPDADNQSSIGFSQPYAVVSGRVAYEGAQGVKDVTISALGGGDDVSTNKSLLFQGGNSNVVLPAKLADFNDKDQLTFQTWIRPDVEGNDKDDTYVLSKKGTYVLKMEKQDDDSASLSLYLLGEYKDNVVNIPFDTWSHLSWTLDLSDDKTSAVTKFYVNGKLVYSGDYSNFISSFLFLFKNEKMMLGTTTEIAGGFAGHLDDIRFWNKALTAEEIAFNYNAFLSGKESGLAAYYRCDEKGSASELFDYSAEGSVFNKNDGKMENTMLVQFSDNVPSADQLSVKTKTDIDGNYLINTLPYTSEGVQYNIVADYGIHEFNPNKRTVFASPLSTVFNGVDFEDVSSFPVSGVVYYEGTEVPVEGASFYVDGVICSKEGSMITTDAKGTFTIEVPIGDHYIHVKKEGHTFVGEGRYPADPNDVGTKFTFEKEMSNLTFYDNTLVPIAGRVVGGKIETEKPLGFGASKNNIGIATIKLSNGEYRLNVVKEQKGTIFSLENNEEDKAIESSTTNINSKSYFKGGGAEEVKYIYITTDPLTGEFSAMLPPLNYTIKDVKVNSNPDINKDAFGTLSNINATNTKMLLKDSVLNEDGSYDKFEYAVASKISYYSNPSFAVTDKSNSVGAFGESEYVVNGVPQEDGSVVNDTLSLYRVNDNDSVIYAYDKPIFIMNHIYNFKLEGFEEYVNKDGAEDVIDRMPLEDVVVTIENPMSAGNTVYLQSGINEDTVEVKAGEIAELAKNQIQLDSLGQATYTWKGGYPNITAPYELGLNIAYEANGEMEQWYRNGEFKGIVFGELPSGNNFITSGPDKVLMRLRDPAGSNSFAFWEKGITSTAEDTYTGAYLTSNDVMTTTTFGAKSGIIAGTPIAGTIVEASSAATLDVGLNISGSVSKTNTTTTTITTTKTISTSDSPDYVGAGGDVFVGTATNIIFGDARNVTLEKDITKKDTIVYAVVLKNIITTGSKFGTAFNYSQNYIENILIPNLYITRNGLLTTVGTQGAIDNYVNNGDKEVYYTLLTADDKNFGKKGTYTMIEPKNGDKIYQDMVLWHNEQVKLWEAELALNEKMKVKAIEDDLLQENISFDQGTKVASSAETCVNEESVIETQFETHIIAGIGSDFSVAGTGVDFSVTTQQGTSSTWVNGSGEEICNTTGYELVDDGLNDALSIDVLNAPDGFGPIFRTRAGQTSCPYEGEILTKYYEPGTEISAATMQIEIPKAEMMNSFATDVPSGSAATYAIQLRNESETGDDVWFDLKVIDASNPNGASISMDGSAFNEGKARTIIVPAGANVEKTIQLKQTSKDVLDYKNIALVLASQCQGDPTGINDVIADTVYLSAQFVPSSSPITLEIEERTMNMFTSDTLELVMKDIDRSFDNFKKVNLNYKKVGDPNWTLGRDWAISDVNDADSKELLPDGGRIAVQFPMSNKDDGKYEFRLQTVSKFGTDGVTVESEVIVVTKDMVRPQALRTPSPSDGILSAGEDVSILFNEDIRKGELTAARNFIVTGVLNNASVANDVALRFDGSVKSAAQTEADVHLANTSFAVDMWLNYTQAGTILEHGSANNKFVASITDEGKLSVTIGDKNIVSDNSIPANKWCYLTMSYDIEGGLFTALAANDASDIELFTAIPMGTYNGVGKLSVGSGMIGAMHELTLWNKARSIAESKMEMNQSKAASTPNLIGYWKLNEGHGIIGRDVARNRHLTLANETWALNNKNYSAQLGEDAYLDLDISTCSAGENDSYAMEMWFRGAAQTNATLWSVGGKKLALGFDANGKLSLTKDTVSQQVSNKNYLDEVWHHVALNVLRNGTAIVYVDGEVAYQIPADTVPALQDAFLTIGANRMYAGGETYNYENNFKGEVDEIRFWNARLTGEYLNNNRYNRVDVENVSGLAAYYPFEKDGLDGANQVVPLFTTEDFSENKVGNAAQVAVEKSENAPALKVAPQSTNVQFSNVASEREIVLNIEAEAYLVEGTTVNFTVRDVRDVNNNISQPITWSAFVNQNRLIWSDDVVSVEQKDGESSEFVVNVSNQSGTAENWTISNMPEWLLVSQNEGRLAPQQNTDVRFSVSASLPLGSYEEVIYLSGNEGINVPLVVRVDNLAEKPNWVADPKYMESSMGMVGQLKIKDVLSFNENDMVAAFVGETCIGVASPVYQSRYDAYFVYLNIGGTESIENDTINFKVWESSTGTIYPVIDKEEGVTYKSNKIKGSVKEPFTWIVEDRIEQRTDLYKRWNWLSIYVEPSNNGVDDVMSSVTSKTTIVKGKESFAQSSKGVFKGTLSSIEVGEMYKVSLKLDEAFTLIGKPINQDSTDIRINKGWNWIGYTLPFNTSLGDAFADLNPQDGDIVKSKGAFAIYQDYEWLGALTTLQPGQGYMYESVASEDKSFNYPKQSSVSGMLKSGELKLETTFTPIDHRKYSGNMTMVAVVKNGSEILSGADVAVFAGEECRTAQVADQDGYLYLTIPGETYGTELTFSVIVNGKPQELDKDLIYVDDAIHGTIEEPYVINIGAETGVNVVIESKTRIYPTVVTDVVNIESNMDIASVSIINASGQTVLKQNDSEKQINVSNLLGGMYLIQITDVNGNVWNGNFVKN